MIDERFLYHSFPRRGAGGESEISKGLAILTAIKEFGLALVPEAFEWRQPTIDGNARMLPVVQRRACLTDLRPAELAQHANVFGRFAIEFEPAVARSLGAVPVFYIPQPDAGGSDGSAIGVALIAIAVDASVIINRLYQFHEILKHPLIVEGRPLPFHVGFEGRPDQRGTYPMLPSEARALISAVSHGTAPLGALDAGMGALLNFFYPADNAKHDRQLEYYRQREWRIAASFAIEGKELVHDATKDEVARLMLIDGEFFSRQLNVPGGTKSRGEMTLFYPSFRGRTFLELARRIIVPDEALDAAKDLVRSLKRAAPVVAVSAV